MTGWIAPLWIMALVGLLFLPTEYRGGASAPHNHALLQLLLDAQDGRMAHVHAHHSLAEGAGQDWLDPAISGDAGSSSHNSPDVGQQQNSAPTFSVISFLILLPILQFAAPSLPRIALDTRRLRGRSPRVLSPPPRVATV